MDTMVCSTCTLYTCITFRKVIQTEESNWKQHLNICFLKIHIKKAYGGVGEQAQPSKHNDKYWSDNSKNQIKFKIQMIPIFWLMS